MLPQRAPAAPAWFTLPGDAPPTYARRMAVLSAQEIYRYARLAGFSPDQAATMTAIALAESGGNTDAHNPRGENSKGLWQINVAAHKDLAGTNLFDPVENARAAFRVSRGGAEIAAARLRFGRPRDVGYGGGGSDVLARATAGAVLDHAGNDLLRPARAAGLVHSEAGRDDGGDDHDGGGRADATPDPRSRAATCAPLGRDPGEDVSLHGIQAVIVDGGKGGRGHGVSVSSAAARTRVRMRERRLRTVPWDTPSLSAAA